mgnify:CR=1 FL=1
MLYVARTEDPGVDRVLYVVRIACQTSESKDHVLGEVLGGAPDAVGVHGHLGGGQCPRLVGAQDPHHCDLLETRGGQEEIPSVDRPLLTPYFP